MTKLSHFILVKPTHKATNIAKIYIKEVARLHEIPKAIVSNRDFEFTSNFWKGLFKAFGASLNSNTAYHPKTDGQTKRVNQSHKRHIMHVCDGKAIQVGRVFVLCGVR